MRRGVVRIDEQTLLDVMGLPRGVIVRSAWFDVGHNALLVGVAGVGLPAEFEMPDRGVQPKIIDLKELPRPEVVGQGFGPGGCG